MARVFAEYFFLENMIRTISLLPEKANSFEPAATMMHSAAIYAHHVLCLVLGWIDAWRCSVPPETIPALFRRSKFRIFVACANAFANICIAFGNLVMVDESYIILGIILIIFLIFIGALFLVVVSPNPKVYGRKKGEVGEEEEEEEEQEVGEGEEEIESESSDDKDHIQPRRVGVGEGEIEEIESKGHTGSSDDGDHTAGRKELRGEEKKRGEVGEEEQEAHLAVQGLRRRRRAGPSLSNFAENTGNKEEAKGGEEKKRQRDEDLWLWTTCRLPCMLLCLMRYFSDMELEMTNCLLFLSCSLGELGLMMERLLHSEEIQLVRPALHVVAKAFLLMGLLTAHTMAAELLGEDVLLVCMPELLAALVWLAIYLGSDDDAAASRNVVRTLKEVFTTKLGKICLAAILSIIATFTATVIVTVTVKVTEGAMDQVLISIMPSAIFAFLFSCMLPFLCAIVLAACLGPGLSPKSEGFSVVIALFTCAWALGLLLLIVAKEVVLLSKLYKYVWF